MFSRSEQIQWAANLLYSLLLAAREGREPRAEGRDGGAAGAQATRRADQDLTPTTAYQMQNISGPCTNAKVYLDREPNRWQSIIIVGAR